MFRFKDPAIDSEHDSIINKFSELLAIVERGDYDTPDRQDLLRCLHHYTSDHFHREEVLMREAHYPGMAAHELSHAYMQDAFTRVIETLRADSPNLKADLSLVRDLFLQHIVTHDESFGAWLARHS